jgi:nicotinamidase-related amidase
MTFSCAGDEGVNAAIIASGCRQIVIAGIEAHVCVLQSAFGFKQAGYEVFVAMDCCSSRAEENVGLANGRLAQAGIGIVSLEMVLFEWMGIAGTPEFKEVSALIR